MAAPARNSNGQGGNQGQSIDYPTLRVTLDPESVAAVAAAVAERVAALTPEPEPDRWLTTEEAAEYLALPISAVHKLTAAETIPFTQDSPGGRCYFLRSALDRWRLGSAFGPWN